MNKQQGPRSEQCHQRYIGAVGNNLPLTLVAVSEIIIATVKLKEFNN